MKKLMLSLFLLSSPLLAADTYTTNAGLVKPAESSLNWGPKLRANYDIIDSSFALLAGTQTFTGLTTFTGDLTFSSTTIGTLRVNRILVATPTYSGGDQSVLSGITRVGGTSGTLYICDSSFQHCGFLANPMGLGYESIQMVASDGIGFQTNNSFPGIVDVVFGSTTSAHRGSFAVVGSSNDATATYSGFVGTGPVSQSVLWSLPTSDGSSNQAMVTDGSGHLSWASVAGGGSSSLQVTSSGVNVTSPTASMNFNSSQFSLAAVGSTSTIALNSSSVTLQGNNLSSTYLTNSSATATYLNTALAASTYLTQSSATATYANLASSQTFSGQSNWTSASPSTFTALTVSGLTAGRCVETTTGGRLTITGAACGSGSGGGASTLAVFEDLTQVSSPTAIMKFDGTTFNVTLPATGTGYVQLESSSVTLQGQNVIKLTSSLQAGATFHVSSGTVGSGGLTIKGNTDYRNSAVASFYNPSNNAASSISGNGGSGQAGMTISASGGITVNGDGVPVTGTDIKAPNVQFSTMTVSSGSVSTFYVPSLASGQCVQTTTGGQLTVTGSACGAGGGAGGYAVQPATVAFNLAQGVTGTTFTFTGPTQSTVTYGLTVGSITVSGSGSGEIDLTEGAAPSGIASTAVIWGDSTSHWPKFIPNNGAAYHMVGASTTITPGHCAQFSSSGSIISAGAACGTGAGGGGAGYAVEPATVTFNLAQGVRASTGTFFTTLVSTNVLVVKSTTNATIFSINNSTITAGDYLLSVASTTTASPIFTVNTVGHVVASGSMTATSLVVNGSGAGQLVLTEGTAPSGVTGKDIIWGDSTSSWPKFNPNNGVAYHILGTSVTVTPGQCAQFTSSGSVVSGACGSGAGDAVLASTQTFTGENTFARPVKLTGPIAANTFTTSMTNDTVSMRFFENGVGDKTLTIMTTGYSLPTQIDVTGKIEAIGALISEPDFGAAGLTAPGILDLFSADSTPVYVSFNERSVANRGALGFLAGSANLIYKQGTEDISGGTQMFAVNSDGGLTPYARTKAQLQALAPIAAGEMFYCSNCTTDGIVVSTGTATGAFGRISARTTAID